MSSVPEKLAQIQKLHGAYVRLTGLAVALDLQGYREMLWCQWLREGFTEADLEAVVRYVRRCVRNNERGFNVGSLRFNSLIGQVDRFGELLAEASSQGRKPEGRNPRAEILRATGRDGSELGTSNNQHRTSNSQMRGAACGARGAGEVIGKMTRDPAAAAAALEEFRKLKGSL